MNYLNKKKYGNYAILATRSLFSNTADQVYGVVFAKFEKSHRWILSFLELPWEWKMPRRSVMKYGNTDFTKYQFFVVPKQSEWKFDVVISS